MRLLLVLLLLVASCGPPPEPSGPPPKERPEPGTEADCSRACMRLRYLGCDEGKPAPAGATCEDVCNNVEQSGATTLDVACVATADSCPAARACGYGADP